MRGIKDEVGEARWKSTRECDDADSAPYNDLVTSVRDAGTAGHNIYLLLLTSSSPAVAICLFRSNIDVRNRKPAVERLNMLNSVWYTLLLGTI